MSTLSFQTKKRIRNYLLSLREQVKGKIQTVEEDDILRTPPENEDLATYSWQQDVRQTKIAVKNYFLELETKIGEALLRLENGTYGLCQNCGRKIEIARLKIMPTTTFCINCK